MKMKPTIGMAKNAMPKFTSVPSASPIKIIPTMGTASEVRMSGAEI
jgi:hypothetical protein